MIPICEVFHCGESVFGLTLPPKCMSCGRTSDCDDESMEVRVHEPRVSRPIPRSIVVRPTVAPRVGFLAAYLSSPDSCLLHCGVSDSRGAVMHFDEGGVHGPDSTTWNECLSVPLANEVVPGGDNGSGWDTALCAHSAAWRNGSQRYHGLRNNCYTFVVAFLNGIHYGGRCDHTKEEVVESLIAPEVERFQGFLRIWTKLQSQEYVVVKGTSASIGQQTYEQHICSGCNCRVEWGSTRHRCVDPACDDLKTDLCDACHSKHVVTIFGHEASHETYGVVERRCTYSCNVCGRTMMPTDSRHRCLVCEDYDLCDLCFSKQLTSDSHSAQHRTVHL